MSAQETDASAPQSDDVTEVHALYRQLLDAWNTRSADTMASYFDDDGTLVGFDGSTFDGSEEIAAHLRQIFADHPTGKYVANIRSVRSLTPAVALLRAVAGLIPPGHLEITPDTNAIQNLVAVRRGARWRIALYQNTPAAFHGRPELSRALTEELERTRSHS